MESWIANPVRAENNNKRVKLKIDDDDNTYAGLLFIDDYIFNGDDEQPIWLVELDNSNTLKYFVDFDEWELE